MLQPQIVLDPGPPPGVVHIISTFLQTLVILVLGYPLVRALTRQLIEPRPTHGPGIAPDLGARLERIEQAVDSIAIEVERISEAQRFTTRLLTEGRSANTN